MENRSKYKIRYQHYKTIQALLVFKFTNFGQVELKNQNFYHNYVVER